MPGHWLSMASLASPCCQPLLNNFVNNNCAALILKGIDFEYKPVHLVQDGGQQVCVSVLESTYHSHTCMYIPACASRKSRYLFSLARDLC